MPQDLEPEDAFVYLNPEKTRITVDIPLYIVTLLQDDGGWEAENTDGDVPIVTLAEDKKIAMGSERKDYITVYSVSTNNEPVTLGYQFENINHVVNLEFLCYKSRQHAIKVFEEAMRVLAENRTDTFGGLLTGRQWLKKVRETPFIPQDKNIWRKSVDIEVMWRFREIQT